MDSAIYPTRIFHDYNKEFQKVRSFYEFSSAFDHIKARKESLPDIDHRGLLVDILQSYNKKLEAPACVQENIEDLSRPETTVVIGGQQAGLFTGPLYTSYKALEIINRARQLTEKMGSKVMPVFWVASEDHDFLEANHIKILKEGREMEKIWIPGSYNKCPLGHIAMEEDYFSALEELKRVTPDTEFKDKYIRIIEESGQKAENLAEWFARIMMKLWGSEGLILFDPLAPGVEKIKAKFLELFYQGEGDFRQARDKAGEALKKEGYELQVQKDYQHTNLFVISHGRRYPVYEENGRYVNREEELDMERQEFYSWLQQNPEKMSPDVLLRPLLQDYMFPVLASINGPGEIAYHGQLREAYRALSLQQPPLIARPFITLVEKRFFRYFQRWDISYQEIFSGNEDLLQELLDRLAPVDIQELFNKTQEEIEQLYDSLLAELKKLDKHLLDLGKKNLERIRQQVEYLRGKTYSVEKRNRENVVGQFNRVRNNLRPDDQLQERYFNIFPYLIRYGPELMGWLQEGLLSADDQHNFLIIGE